MYSIGKPLKSVNPLILEVLDRRAEVTTPVINPDGTTEIKLKSLLKPSGGCPYNIPLELRKNTKRVTRGPNKPAVLKYPELSREAENGFINDDVLRLTYARRLKERPFILLSDSSGEAITFNGAVKGCPEYNSMLENRIRAICEPLNFDDNYVFFFTDTFDYNNLAKNMVEAWQIFSSEHAKLLRAIKRAFGAFYCDVFESTYKGYPHAHTILAIPKNIAANRVGSNGTWCKLWCDLMEFIRKRLLSPIFSLQCAYYGSLEKYISKYITKTMALLSDVTGNEREKLGEETRKALLTCLMPCLAGVRQFRSSEHLRKAIKATAPEVTEKEVKNLEQIIYKQGLNKPAWKALLSILNNLTVCQCTNMRLLQKKFHKYLIKRKSGYWKSNKDPEFMHLWNISTPMGCTGCFLTDARDALLAGDELPAISDNYILPTYVIESE